MSGTYTPLTSLNAMEIDDNEATEVFPSGSGDTVTPAPTAPPKANHAFGKPSELPATKAMKTLIKNSVTKFQRLQDRLLKYTQHYNDANDGFADPAHLKAVKKFYQFRLVDIQRIRKDTLSELDNSIALVVLKFLIQDVQADIEDLKIFTSSTAMRNKLQKELQEYATNALSQSLVANDSQINEYKTWWVVQINHNCDLLRAFCLKTFAGASSQVKEFVNMICECILIVKESLNTPNIFVNAEFLGTPTSEERSGSCEP